MPRILIIHASLGSGHVSAAHSLEKAFHQLGEQDVHVTDLLTHTSPLIADQLKRWYDRVSQKTPLLFKLLYTTTDIKQGESVEEVLETNRVLAGLQLLFYQELLAYLYRLQPDAIVSTMPFASMVIEGFRREHSFTQPDYVVLTDFMYHASWFMPGVSAYFVASDLLRQVLINWGIDPELVYATGIPVNPAIAEPKSPDAMRKKHGLPGGPVVILFAGGLLPERVRRMVELLLRSPVPMTVVAVAGRNEQMQAALAGLESTPQVQLRQLGFVDYADDLLAASDLVISKSGGLITSEVLARGVPMVVVSPIPGQEEWNADFVTGAGAGVQLRIAEMAPYAVYSLLADPERLAIMRRNSARIGRPRAALEIAEHVLRDAAG
jgi:processive 1,2-diacylglycerol beta-glucosyltransferase